MVETGWLPRPTNSREGKPNLAASAAAGPGLELVLAVVLLADELDASLHPFLVLQVMRLFQDPTTNPRRAQLLFNSHDVTALDDPNGRRPIGRDQIWFSEKDNDGRTRVYCLADLGPRKNESIGKRYLDGRYGGTPIIASEEFDAVAELIGGGRSA